VSRRRVEGRRLSPKTEQMREQRVQDAWMRDRRTVEAVLYVCTKLRGRKLFEAGLKLAIIATRPRAVLQGMGWGTANVAGVRAELREMRRRAEQPGWGLKELRAAYIAYVVTPKETRRKTRAAAKVTT
jgi:hypothetical protein